MNKDILPKIKHDQFIGAYLDGFKSDIEVNDDILWLIQEIEKLRSEAFVDDMNDLMDISELADTEGKIVTESSLRNFAKNEIDSLTKELESVKNHVGEIETIQELKKTIEGQAKRVGDLLRLQKDHSREIKTLKSQLAESQEKVKHQRIATHKENLAGIIEDIKSGKIFVEDFGPNLIKRALYALEQIQ